MSKLPVLTPREVVSALKRGGFIEARQRGSHLFLYHPTRRVSATVAIHAKDLPLPTLKAILKQAQLAEDEFLELLR